jgi:hypothetical protein
MAEFPLSDPLLVELRRALPEAPDRLADEPGAVALLERIIWTESRKPGHREDVPVQEALHRRRRGTRSLRGVAVGSAAAAVVTAAIVAGVGGHQPKNTAATAIQSVARRAKVALTAAVTQYVEYSVTTTTYPKTEAIASRVTSEWTSGTRTNIEVADPSGAPFEDVWYSGSVTAPRGTTEVLYPINAWWTKTVAIGVTQMQDITGRDIAARIEGWVNAGKLTMVGTPTIGGQKTIELSGNAVTLGQAARTLEAPPPTSDQFNLTMWLNPTTYLPVRLATTYTTPTGPARTMSTTSTVSWLPTTPANLSKLEGVVPSGFTHLEGPPSVATGSQSTTSS